MTIKGKIENHYETISPGPKYHFESRILDKNKVLSREKRTGSVRIVLPCNKSRILKTEGDLMNETHFSSTLFIHSANTENMIVTRRGKKMLGVEGQKAIIPSEKRFSSTQPSLKIPGPGY